MAASKYNPFWIVSCETLSWLTQISFMTSEHWEKEPGRQCPHTTEGMTTTTVLVFAFFKAGWSGWRGWGSGCTETSFEPLLLLLLKFSCAGVFRFLAWKKLAWECFCKVDWKGFGTDLNFTGRVFSAIESLGLLLPWIFWSYLSCPLLEQHLFPLCLDHLLD